MDILDDALKLIPGVRLDAGLPPLVTPTSQIIGVQAGRSAINLKHGRPKYQNPSNQFIALVKGEYGKTPVPIDPDFRKLITGSAEEVPYDTSNYKRQDNPVLPEFGGVRLAKDEKEQLLLELFPTVAASFLREQRKKEYLAAHPEKVGEKEDSSKVEPQPQTQNKENAKKGNVMTSPMPGNIVKILVNEGDAVKRGDALLILEAMKMENTIPSEFSGKVSRVYVKKGDNVEAGQPLVEIV